MTLTHSQVCKNLRRWFNAACPGHIAQARRRDHRAAVWQPDATDAYCPRCGHSTTPEQMQVTGCPRCRDRRLPWQRVVRLGAYRAPLNLWIREMKYQQRWQWTNWFGQQLARRLPSPPPDRCAIVCAVPMHWQRRWRRGFNQSQLLAQSIAHHRQWQYLPLLNRPHPGTAQTRVLMSQREQNVRHQFAIQAMDLTGSHVVLVDDVQTTGATLRQCARLLRRQGADSITLAVIAVAHETR